MGRPVALVTGASSGIGRALACKLVEGGYYVVLCARGKAKLNALAEQLGHENTDVFPCDLEDAEQTSRMVNEVITNHGQLHVLANVAGLALIKPLAETDLAEWQRVLRVNLTSTFLTTRAAWPTFVRQESGMVVNVSSMASIDPFPGFGAYAAAKAGVNLLTSMTAREGRAHGICAVCIAPGAVETPMLRGMFDEKAIPPDKALSPEEVAQMIMECIDGSRAFQSGETLTCVKS